MKTANTTIAIQYDGIKIIPIFLSDWQKYIFGMLQNFSN